MTPIKNPEHTLEDFSEKVPMSLSPEDGSARRARRRPHGRARPPRPVSTADPTSPARGTRTDNPCIQCAIPRFFTFPTVDCDQGVTG